MLVCIGVIIWVLPALAYERNSPEYWDIREELLQEWYARQERMESLAEELRADSSWEWSPRKLECYYLNVVDYLYAWERYQVHCNEADYTLDSLRLIKAGRDWPRDPLNNWEPLPVQDISDEPLPGGLVMQVCPVDRYTDFYHSGYPRARSFEISIYAPQGIEAQRVRPRAGNRCWAVHRPEMLRMQGWFEPPYTLISDQGYDKESAGEWAQQFAQTREDSLDWYGRTYQSKQPGGNSISLDLALSQIGSVCRMDRELAGLEAQYDGISPEQWEKEDLDNWCSYVMYMVYGCSFAYGSMEGSVFDSFYDLGLLESSGFLPRIPPNIFDGGRPVRILSPEDGFSPGDLCLQYPTSYWAGCNAGGMTPRMNQLYIYGAGRDTAREAELEERLFIRDGTYKVPSGAKDTTGKYNSAYLLYSDYRQSQCLS